MGQAGAAVRIFEVTGKTFVIGDVHGCAETLGRLLRKISWNPDADGLVFVGDTIDRGPDSRGVVELILHLRSRSPRVVCLRGNHEVMLLDYLEGRGKDAFFLNGGAMTVKSYGGSLGEGDCSWLPREHRVFFETLPFYVELEKAYVVHGGFRPGVPLEAQEPMEMVWIREPFISSRYDFGKRVIFGHTPFREPFIMANKIGIDTGAVYGNRLTCIELPEERFHSVESERKPSRIF